MLSLKPSPRFARRCTAARRRSGVGGGGLRARRRDTSLPEPSSTTARLPRARTASHRCWGACSDGRTAALSARPVARPPSAGTAPQSNFSRLVQYLTTTRISGQPGAGEWWLQALRLDDESHSMQETTGTCEDGRGGRSNETLLPTSGAVARQERAQEMECVGVLAAAAGCDSAKLESFLWGTGEAHAGERNVADVVKLRRRASEFDIGRCSLQQRAKDF